MLQEENTTNERDQCLVFKSQQAFLRHEIQLWLRAIPEVSFKMLML